MQEVIIAKNESGQRLDKYLHKFMPYATTSFFYKMLRKKNIVLNGKKAEGNEKLIEGDHISFFLADDTISKFRTESHMDTSLYVKAFHSIRGIDVLYEDEDVVFLNKPVNILTQQAEGQSISLNEWLLGYLLENNKITSEELRTFKPSICNRLDRNTTGIVLCGKSLLGLQVLSKALVERSVHKYYRCMVEGTVTESMALDGYLCKDEKTNTVAISKQALPGYEPIRTNFVPIEHRNGYTELEVELITGKTHQIRAHLASIAHPIVGDYKYSGKQDKQYHHQLLHAYRVVFPDNFELSHLSGREFICPKPFDWL